MSEKETEKDSKIVSHSPFITPLALTPFKQAGKNRSIAIAIVIAGLLIAGGIFFSGNNSQSGTLSPTATAPPPTTGGSTGAELAVNVGAVTPADHIRGDVSAKVKIIEFSDFDCPFCQRVHETFKEIISEYADSEVAWVYRHFPIPQLHPNAEMKAVASECAAEQGGDDAFWQFADRYFERQDASAGEELVITIAQQIGLNKNEFQNCLDENDFVDKINGHITDASESGGRGTPFTILVSGSNYIPVSGAQPYATFKNHIESLLNN